ncbi:MAG TPA: tetratricopeptide repeat protein, partial [Chryseolinea sp.]
MRLIILVIIFSLLVQKTNAQPRMLSIDSLKRQLEITKHDTSRVLLLKLLGTQYLVSQPEISKGYYQEGLILSRNLGYKKGQADCMRFIGNVLKRQGQYPEALDNFFKALTLSESIGDSAGISAGLGHIGDVYSEQGDHYKARHYFFRSKKIDETTHNDFELILMLMNIGKSYQRQDMRDSAFLFLNQCYKLLNEKKVYFWSDNLFTTLGQLEASDGKDAEALVYFRKSIPYSITKSAHANLSDTYQGIAALYKKSGQTDSCIYYGQKSFASAQKVNYLKGILAASQ